VLEKIMPQTLHSARLPAHLFPILCVAYSCLLPREISFEIQGAVFLPYRILLILVFPFAIARLAQSPVRPSIIDAFVGFGSAWFVVSLMYSTSFSAGVESGVAFALDYGLAYLVGRASLRSAEDFRLLFRYFLPGIVMLTLVLAAESIGHRYLLRPFAAGVFGQPAPNLVPVVRMGLLRATGPFPHPILAGIFLSGVMAFAWYVSHNIRTRLIGIAAGLGAIFTVSSAAIIGGFIAITFIGMDIIRRMSRLPVFPIAATYTFLMLVAIAMGSKSGLLNFVIRNLTFDSSTGYYRTWIWQYGGAEAMANPLFGIGLRDWVRPEQMYTSSVDSYWLLITMMHGFPALAATALAMVGTIVLIFVTQRHRHPADQDVGKAIMLFLFIIIISGFTVHLWEGLNCWILMVIGCGASLASQARHCPAPVWHAPQSAHPAFVQPSLAAE